MIKKLLNKNIASQQDCKIVLLLRTFTVVRSTSKNNWLIKINFQFMN